MELDFLKIKQSGGSPEKGSLLISEPFAGDGFFRRSVVLLTEHNSEGSMGFILNKKVRLNLSELLDDFPNFDAEVSLGGPVNTDTVHYIHTLGNKIPHSLKVIDNLYWGGDFEFVKKLIQSGSITTQEIRFFLGYSGWEANQLAGEMKDNFWLVSSTNTKIIMNHPIEKIWDLCVRQLGKKYKIWVNFPENPSWN